MAQQTQAMEQRRQHRGYDGQCRIQGSKSGQRKKPFKRNNQGPSSLDRILERSCQIHGTPDKPANHTNRECWVFKQAGKINAENKDKGLHSDDDEEPRRPNKGDRRNFPPGENGQHDLCHSHSQTGTKASTEGRLCDGASRPKIQPMVSLSDHL